MGTEVTEAKNTVQSLQNQLSGKGSSARYADSLSTQSFVSIFNQVQMKHQAQKNQNDNFGIYINDKKLNVEIARELDKKSEKTQEQFQTRLEQQKQKQEANAKDYKPELFNDTFLGTMISLMEALQNSRTEPLFTQKDNSENADNLPHLRGVATLNTPLAENQDDKKPQNPSLRLVIDGVPTDQNSSQESNPFADLSDQDIALSYIFGNRQQEHQQLRKLSEGSLDQFENQQNNPQNHETAA
jgi:uncharacterized protein YegL